MSHLKMFRKTFIFTKVCFWQSCKPARLQTVRNNVGEVNIYINGACGVAITTAVGDLQW